MSGLTHSLSPHTQVRTHPQLHQPTAWTRLRQSPHKKIKSGPETSHLIGQQSEPLQSVPRQPSGLSRWAKALSPRFEYRLGLFFIQTEAPQRTETHLRKKRLVCVPSPSLKTIIWPNSCATLNHLHCRPKTIGFPGVPISIANCATYCKIQSFADPEEINVHFVEKKQ